MFKNLLMGLVSLASVSAMATHYSGNRTYFVQYHFSNFAFDKPVKNVMVHTAVLQSGCMGENYWADIHDIPMAKNGDHFNTRAVLNGNLDSGCNNSRGAIVQYFVTFQDDTKIVTSPGLIADKSLGSYDSVGDKGSEAIDKANTELMSAPDAVETESVSIDRGHVS